MNPIVIGITGTAKNTGKTTATGALSEYFAHHQTPVGITSIGYDGERVDNVTGLPKPRLHLKPGTLVALAEKCLAASSARINVLARSDIFTPLGRVIYGQVTSEGLVVVAGPNKSRELRQVIHRLAEIGAGLILVDGALNRIAPMVETTGIVLATGAAKETNVEKLVWQTKSIEKIFCLPQVSLKHSLEKTIILSQDLSTILAEGSPSMLSEASLRDLLAECSPGAGAVLVLPGIVSLNCLAELLPWMSEKLSSVIFRDPVKLMVTGDVVAVTNFIDQVEAKGGQVGYLWPLKLIAVTVNPFYPRYRYEYADYLAEYVDARHLYSAMAQALSVPVYDIFVHGVEELAQKIRHLSSDACTF
ncbi:MAG: hypothetical protein KGZ75_13790 [Syntrophomonadaceae bacterium]|nr:hypothetical protein [Syntrophomonadaceae bacterium]